MRFLCHPSVGGHHETAIRAGLDIHCAGHCFECEGFGWDYEREDAFVIVFTDGTALIPSQDPEGNGAGFIITAKVVK